MEEIQTPDVPRPQKPEMETIETNLYKVMIDGWHSPAYVAAENQQQAIDKVAPRYEIAFPERANIQYVADIII